MKGFVAFALLALAAAPLADKPPVIKEWPVPWGDSRPRDPFVDPTPGRIYF